MRIAHFSDLHYGSRTLAEADRCFGAAIARDLDAAPEGVRLDYPDPLRDDLDPPGYVQWAADWQARGASHLGGCCGIGPEHIAVLAQKLAG